VNLRVLFICIIAKQVKIKGGAGSADAVEKKNTRIAFQGVVLVIVMATAAFQIWM
ncbi:hypothetical protein ANCCAN_02012, partial [Ancylostoma caninum]